MKPAPDEKKRVKRMTECPLLVVIGIHREELAFGREVADHLDDPRLKVLAVPEGLSGKRPLTDQQFKYQTLHKALYLQLLPYVLGHHTLLLDLHSGTDPAGPSADLICADTHWRAALAAEFNRRPALTAGSLRIVPLGSETEFPHARTVIPEQIWNHPAFTYLGLEIYLPETAPGRTQARDLALQLISIAADLATVQAEHLSTQQRLAVGSQVHT